MDTDSNDGTSPETLNGETKPDAAKLAQTAIIKQDVMLSATSTQSPLAPVSSVFTMPSVSLPHASIAGAGALGLADQLFMSVPSVADTATSPSATDAKSDINGVLPTLTSQTQLLGQPQVASQFFLNQQAAVAGAGSGSPSVPVQQILIPVSTGNGTQQFISIPVSLGPGGNQQIQLLSTSNGQIIATNLASLQALTQPLNLAANSLSSRDSNSNSSSSNSNHHHTSAAATSLASQLAAALPPLLTANSQGQLLAVSPQLIGQMSLSQVNAANRSSSSSSNHNHTSAVLQSSLTSAAVAAAHNKLSTSAPTVNGLPPNVSQLLPMGNCTESTTVDGINLDEIKEFARQFKIRRLSLGLTQTQVGQALSATEGPAYSQSAICRFEKLDITPKSAQKIKPVLERWMSEAEERYKNGVQNLTDFIGSEPSKKRKRRTSFTPQALEVLNQYFERNTHPSGTEMTELSERLNYDREVIRVWFCNKRQALKNTIKKLKQEGP
ncbi:POU domain, class 6, transcription factor 1-like isoform X2 [Littorina saxatilis]|uniref:POU domain protein n=1 Tax=Littorina saxatilis TaxID=31220 RepID=A0AAN9BR66_9CAEN